LISINNEEVEMNKQVQRGVSLIEACVTLAVASVLVGSAVPSFKESSQKRVLQGVAQEVPTEIAFARSAAVVHAGGVWLSYAAVAGGTCALVHTGSKGECACSADSQPVCSGDAQALKTTLHPLPVSIAKPIHFDHTNGSVSPTATIKVQQADGSEVRHIVNIVGRVRSCSPQGAVKGYPVC
jgi:type IV fimbrial biogenesis protein FimT